MSESIDESEEVANQKFQAKWQQVTDRLVFARASAIDSYASVEQQLMNVFSALLDIDQDVGSLVFYRVVNARSRNAMIQDLVVKKHGQTYKRYWISMLRFIGKLDQKRNEIVHWHLGGVFTRDGQEPALNHPKDFWQESGAAVTLTEIDEFIRKANFAAQSIAVFWLWAHGPLSDANGTTWIDTFKQPVVYPPPDDHPLSRLTREFGSRLPPSRELDKRVDEFKLSR